MYASVGSKVMQWAPKVTCLRVLNLANTYKPSHNWQVIHFVVSCALRSLYCSSGYEKLNILIFAGTFVFKFSEGKNSQN